MFGIPSIYAIGAGAVGALAIIGGFAYQNTQIHKYHTEYNCVSYGTDCKPKSQVETVPDLKATIKQMTKAQNDQTVKTEDNIVKIVQGPERIKTVIKTIREAPEPANCGTPPLPEELKI